MIRIRDITLPPEHNPGQLQYEAARLLRLSPSRIRRLRIVRRSVDARKKPEVKIIYTVDVAVEGSENKVLKTAGCKRAALAPTAFYQPPKPRPAPEKRPVVVGFGPAGMFAALILALAGQKPLVLERGEDAESRHKKVDNFWNGGCFDPASNVQFGEGGAGTFSDGKLNTGVNNPRISWILEQFVAAGAGEDILFDAKPHVGTDVLLEVVQNIRKRIIALGGEVRFQTKVTDFEQEKSESESMTVQDTSEDQSYQITSVKKISLKYDDRYAFDEHEEFAGYEIHRIEDETVDSYKVSKGRKTTSKDEHVLISGQDEKHDIIAAGTGSAKVILVPEKTAEETDIEEMKDRNVH